MLALSAALLRQNYIGVGELSLSLQLSEAGGGSVGGPVARSPHGAHVHSASRRVRKLAAATPLQVSIALGEVNGMDGLSMPVRHNAHEGGFCRPDTASPVCRRSPGDAAECSC